MSDLPRECVLRLAAGCRLNSGGTTEDMLLVPEGALRLKGPARAVLELCDGARTVSEIVTELQRRFIDADASRIESETVALLARLRARGALETV